MTDSDVTERALLIVETAVEVDGAARRSIIERQCKGVARVRDPEALRELSPELREGWQQFWHDLDAAIVESARGP